MTSTAGEYHTDPWTARRVASEQLARELITDGGGRGEPLEWDAEVSDERPGLYEEIMREALDECLAANGGKLDRSDEGVSKTISLMLARLEENGLLLESEEQDEPFKGETIERAVDYPTRKRAHDNGTLMRAMRETFDKAAVDPQIMSKIFESGGIIPLKFADKTSRGEVTLKPVFLQRYYSHPYSSGYNLQALEKVLQRLKREPEAASCIAHGRIWVTTKKLAEEMSRTPDGVRRIGSNDGMSRVEREQISDAMKLIGSISFDWHGEVDGEKAHAYGGIVDGGIVYSSWMFLQNGAKIKDVWGLTLEPGKAKKLADERGWDHDYLHPRTGRKGLKLREEGIPGFVLDLFNEAQLKLTYYSDEHKKRFPKKCGKERKQYYGPLKLERLVENMAEQLGYPTKGGNAKKSQAAMIESVSEIFEAYAKDYSEGRGRNGNKIFAACRVATRKGRNGKDAPHKMVFTFTCDPNGAIASKFQK